MLQESTKQISCVKQLKLLALQRMSFLDTLFLQSGTVFLRWSNLCLIGGSTHLAHHVPFKTELIFLHSLWLKFIKIFKKESKGLLWLGIWSYYQILTYFMQLVCWCPHILLATMTAFIGSCLIFLRRLEVSITDRRSVLPSLIVMCSSCSPHPICVSWRQRFHWGLNPSACLSLCAAQKALGDSLSNTLVENMTSEILIILD